MGHSILTKSVARAAYIESVKVTDTKWDLSSAGRASALQAEGHRFESYRSHFADVAQLAEQLICNQQVNGSSPFIGFVMIIKAFS